MEQDKAYQEAIDRIRKARLFYIFAGENVLTLDTASSSESPPQVESFKWTDLLEENEKAQVNKLKGQGVLVQISHLDRSIRGAGNQVITAITNQIRERRPEIPIKQGQGAVFVFDITLPFDQSRPVWDELKSIVEQKGADPIKLQKDYEDLMEKLDEQKKLARKNYFKQVMTDDGTRIIWQNPESNTP